MTIRAKKFTPEVLLSAPKRGPGIPNGDASLILYNLSTYSFASHSETKEIRILNRSRGTSKVITDNANAKEPVWMEDGYFVLWLESESASENSATKLVVNTVKDRYTAGIIDAPVSGLKIKRLDNGAVAFLVTALATPEGDLYKPGSEPDSHSSARIYPSFPVRGFDFYHTQNRTALWYGSLERASDGQYALVSPVRNVLKGTGLSLWTEDTPMGAPATYDLSFDGIVVVARETSLNMVQNDKADLYHLTVKNTKTSTFSAPKKVEIKGNLGNSGVCSSPQLSPDGKKLAFLKNPTGHISMHVMLVPNIEESLTAIDLFPSRDETGDSTWDTYPTKIAWGVKAECLYITASDTGRTKLFTTPVTEKVLRNGSSNLPRAITSEGTVTAFSVLADGKVFTTSSSFVDDSIYAVVYPTSPSPALVSSKSQSGYRYGLNKDQFSELYYENREGQKIHSWLVKPSDFEPSQKYPLAIIIHGGPQSSWNDEWIVRWNAGIFAEEGFIVMMPNITGSTGFGRGFTNAVFSNWGGTPYRDIEDGYKFLKESCSYIDTDNAVLLGASYGGYMANWVQGQELGRKMKAIVTHDGIFSIHNLFSSDIIAPIGDDFGGPIWSDLSLYDKFSPSRYTQNWSTPHLIVHSDKDYRCPVTEGLAPFNVLQARGIESKFLNFPDENHWVLKPENSLIWYREVVGWIKRFTSEDKRKEEVVR